MRVPAFPVELSSTSLGESLFLSMPDSKLLERKRTICNSPNRANGTVLGFCVCRCKKEDGKIRTLPLSVHQKCPRARDEEIYSSSFNSAGFFSHGLSKKNAPS